MNDLQKIENLFQEGLTYFKSGEYFEAHESWEELWSDFYLLIFKQAINMGFDVHIATNIF